jgi:hypothetical protein
MMGSESQKLLELIKLSSKTIYDGNDYYHYKHTDKYINEIETLLQNKCKIKFKHAEMAVERCNVDILQLLEQYGFNIHSRSKLGYTLWDASLSASEGPDICTNGTKMLDYLNQNNVEHTFNP